MKRTKEELLRAYEAAPKAIQDALSEGAAIDFMVGVPDRYKLHIDIAGTVTELIRDMLLGLMSPADFLTELESLGIGREVAATLVNDLNQEVFVPLRTEMRQGTAPVITARAEPIVEQPRAPTIVPPSRPATEPLIPPPALDYTPATPVVTLPGSNEPAPMPAVSTPEIVAPVTPTPTQPPAAIVASPALPVDPAQYAQHVIHTIQHPVQPGLQPTASVHVYLPQSQPLAVPIPQATAFTAQQLSETPSSVPAPSFPAYSYAPPSTPVVPTPAVSAPVPPTAPPINQYGSDPYREPVI